MTNDERIALIMDDIWYVLRSHKVNSLEAHEISAEIALQLAKLSDLTPEYFMELMTCLGNDYEEWVKSDG